MHRKLILFYRLSQITVSTLYFAKDVAKTKVETEAMQLMDLVWNQLYEINPPPLIIEAHFEFIREVFLGKNEG